MRTTIDKAGRVVIPAVIRARAGLTPGTEIEVSIEDGSVRLVRKVPGPKLVRVGKRLVARPTVPAAKLPRVDFSRLVAEERAQQRRFMGGVAEERIVGGRIYDAHIADIARRARADVVITDNVRHFTGLARYGIRVASAADFASEVSG
jgi:AbrB family looped-hinge helix DNA binding protein